MFIMYLYSGFCFSFEICKNKPFVLNVTFYSVERKEAYPEHSDHWLQRETYKGAIG